MPDAFTGFTSGFTASRDEQIKRNADREAANRAMADKMFSFLLASRDPQLQELALRGMSTPSNPKKGLAGYFGQMDSPHDPIYQQVIARMNEMIPDEDGGPPRSSAPTPSAGPGSAAMSTNAPVQSGSAPIQLPGQQLEMPPSSPPPPATDTSSGVSAAMPPDLEGMEGPPAMPQMPMGAPPESKWKRRGTQVASAEEIADAQQQRIRETNRQTAQFQSQAQADEPLIALRNARTPAEQAVVMARYGFRPAGAGATDPSYAEGPMSLEHGPTRWIDGKLFLMDGTTPVPPGSTFVGQTGAGADLDELNRLLTPTEVAGMNDPRVRYGMTRGQAAKLNLRVMTPDQRIRLGALKQFVPMLKRAESLLAQIQPTQGSGLSGRVGASLNMTAQRLRGMEAYRQLEGLLNVMKGPTAKIIAAEAGRLTQQDIERAASMYPNIGIFADSPDVARSMLQQFRGIVDDALVSAGEPPTNWEGISAEAAAPPPTRGEVRQLSSGEWVRIDQVYANGTFDGTPFTPGQQQRMGTLSPAQTGLVEAGRIEPLPFSSPPPPAVPRVGPPPAP